MKRTTTTTLVMDALIRADDFLTLRQLMAATGESCTRVSAALHAMKKLKAVDCLETDGALWWYATPDSDARSRTVAERELEEKPRKPRKTKTKTV